MMRRASRGVVVCITIGSLLGLQSADARTRASGDFVYVTKQVMVPPESAGSVDALCPEGTRAVGAGGGVTEGGIRTAQIIPFDSDDGGVEEDNGSNAQAWNHSSKPKTLRAVAICSRGSDAAALTYNRDSSVFPSTTTGGHSPVSCAGGAGEEPLGGGAGVPANAFDRLTTSQPLTSGWRYGIRGTNPGTRTMSGVVVCLPATSRDVTVITRTVTIGAGGTRTIKAKCPPGTNVSGGGIGNNGLRYEIRRSVPFDGRDRDRVPDDGWSITLRDTLEEEHEAHGTAICAGAVLP